VLPLFPGEMNSSVLYNVINIFFYVFHIGLILFNLFGWIPRRWRKWNLITLLLTAFSWFVLGIFYGFGYCFLTDWHWDVREKLGYSTDSNSYIHFLITDLTRMTIDEAVVDMLTAVLFFAALVVSIVVNVRDRLNAG
jgi:hypothetical protein